MDATAHQTLRVREMDSVLKNLLQLNVPSNLNGLEGESRESDRQLLSLISGSTHNQRRIFDQSLGFCDKSVTTEISPVNNGAKIPKYDVPDCEDQEDVPAPLSSTLESSIPYQVLRKRIRRKNKQRFDSTTAFACKEDFIKWYMNEVQVRLIKTTFFQNYLRTTKFYRIHSIRNIGRNLFPLIKTN